MRDNFFALDAWKKRPLGKHGNNLLSISVILCMNEEDKEKLLNPRFDLNTESGVRGFLEWLFDPEADKALEQFIKETADETLD